MYSRHQANFHTCTNFDDTVSVHGKHNSVLAASTFDVCSFCGCKAQFGIGSFDFCYDDKFVSVDG